MIHNHINTYRARTHARTHARTIAKVDCNSFFVMWLLVLAFVLPLLTFCTSSTSSNHHPVVVVNRTARRITLSNGFVLASFNLEHPSKYWCFILPRHHLQ